MKIIISCTEKYTPSFAVDFVGLRPNMYKGFSEVIYRVKYQEGDLREKFALFLELPKSDYRTFLLLDIKSSRKL